MTPLSKPAGHRRPFRGYYASEEPAPVRLEPLLKCDVPAVRVRRGGRPGPASRGLACQVSAGSRYRGGRVVAAVAGLLVLLAGAGGCESPRSSDSLASFAENRMEMRSRWLLWTAEMLVEQEQRKTEQLERTLKLFERGIRDDVAQTGRNLRMLDYYLRREFERFEERMPLYQHEAQRLLGGKPQNIPRNAVILFI